MGKRGKGKKSRVYDRDGPDIRDVPEGYEDADLPILMRSSTASAPKDPPPDPVAVARAIAAISTVSVGMPDTFTHPITYVVASNGIFKVQTSVLGQVIAKVDGVPLTTTSMTQGFKLGVPKIPYTTLQQIVAFFKAVCKKAGRPVEAYCQIWYSTEGEQPVWIVRVPTQKVGGASVHHDGETQPTAQMIHVADVHSHGSMSAFFSGTDDADEARQGVRIFGVIGNVDTTRPSMRWRIGVGNGKFIDAKLSDVVACEGQETTLSIPITALVEGGLTLDLTKLGTIWPDITIPAAWLAQVDVSSTPTISHYGGGHYHQPGYGWSGGAVEDDLTPRERGTFVGSDGGVWKMEPGKGWVRTNIVATGGDAVGGRGVTTPQKSFHTKAGTFVVDKDRLRHFPLVGSKGV